jgi:transcriptional regulator with XRE-family HTH domain
MLCGPLARRERGVVTHRPERLNATRNGPAERQSRPGLVRARLARGWTQEQAAESIGVSPTTWARWERGAQNVRPVYRRLLIERWRARPAEVEMWLQREERSTPAAPSVDAAVVESWLVESMPSVSDTESARQLWRWEMDTSRRQLLIALPFIPASLGEWLLDWRYAEPAGQMPANTDGARVGLSDVRRVREAHAAFARMDHQFGAGLVRPAVTDFMDTRLAPLLKGSATDETRAQLLSAAAGMSRMAGWMAFDLGHQGQAQQHFGHALKLAQAAGDDLTAAWILATMAQQACDLGHGRWAVRLASAASEAGTRADASPRVKASLSLRQAHAHSILSGDNGDVAHARRLVSQHLGQADKHFAHGPSDGDPAWIAHFSEAELAGEGGLCWRGVGDYQRGIALQQQAMTGFGTPYARSVQLTQTSLAEGHLGQGELEAAISHARAAVHSVKTLTSTRATAFIREFADRLQPYRDNPRVREFDEELRVELAG